MTNEKGKESSSSYDTKSSRKTSMASDNTSKRNSLYKGDKLAILNEKPENEISGSKTPFPEDHGTDLFGNPLQHAVKGILKIRGRVKKIKNQTQDTPDETKPAKSKSGSQSSRVNGKRTKKTD